MACAAIQKYGGENGLKQVQEGSKKQKMVFYFILFFFALLYSPAILYLAYPLSCVF